MWYDSCVSFVGQSRPIRRDADVPTLEGTPAERRAAVLAELDVVPADLRAMCSLAQANGAWRYVDFTWRGDSRAGAVFQTVEGEPFRSPWSPEMPPARGVNAFQAGIDGWGTSDEELARLPIWRAVYVPSGVQSERRMLVYDGDAFVAWISVSRLGDAPRFSRKDDLALARAASRARRIAVAHARACGARLGDGTGHLVVNANGGVELACGVASAWLDAGGLAWIAEATRRVDGGEPIDRIVADGVSARPVRFAGDGACRYLWIIDRAEPVRCSPLARLTPRQREVAEVVAAGATLAEAARHLDLSVETAREHLKAAYARLDVGSRVELARTVRPPRD